MGKKNLQIIAIIKITASKCIYIIFITLIAILCSKFAIFDQMNPKNCNRGLLASKGWHQKPEQCIMELNYH